MGAFSSIWTLGLGEKRGGPECLYKYIDNLGITSKKKNPPWKRWVLCLLDNLCGLPGYKQQSDCI